MAINPCETDFFNWLHNQAEKSDEPANIQTLRENVKNLGSFVDEPADIDFKDIKIIAKEGHSIRLRYYHDTNKIRPLVIFLPGNGFIYNLFEENHSVISKIAKHSGCHAVMVDYRLAPEHPYPAPLEDALDAVNFIFNHIELFKADKNKVILAGYSSGANLTAVITNLLRNDQTISIFHQFLISGAYDYTNSLHEYDEYSIQDRFLSPEEAQYSFTAYCNEAQRKEPTCSPYWNKDLSRLPPTTIMVSEYDGGRSQSEGYAKKLLDAGNDITKIVLSGQTHSTILYRKALSDGADPALVAALQIKNITTINEK